MRKYTGWALYLLLFTIIAAIPAENIWAKGRKPDGNKVEEPAVKTGAAEVRQTPEVHAPITEKFTSPLQIKKIAVKEAKSIFDSGKGVFIDGRSPVSYSAKHIKGALNCSMGEFDLQVAELKSKFPPDTLLIVYCSGQTCGLADSVAERIAQSGFVNIVVYSGGLSDWVAANYPSEP